MSSLVSAMDLPRPAPPTPVKRVGQTRPAPPARLSRPSLHRRARFAPPAPVQRAQPPLSPRPPLRLSRLKFPPLLLGSGVPSWGPALPNSNGPTASAELST